MEATVGFQQGETTVHVGDSSHIGWDCHAKFGVINDGIHPYCLHGGPRSIAKLANITPITMVYGTYNYSYWRL